MGSLGEGEAYMLGKTSRFVRKLEGERLAEEVDERAGGVGGGRAAKTRISRPKSCC